MVEDTDIQDGQEVEKEEESWLVTLLANPQDRSRAPLSGSTRLDLQFSHLPRF
jgi:hypothetical protein